MTDKSSKTKKLQAKLPGKPKPAVAKSAAEKKSAGKAKPAAVEEAAPVVAVPDLATLRERIDGIDLHIQQLIGERAQFANQVGKAKGKLAAAVDYYRPEREAQVLRRVVDRNDGPLNDEVLVRLFREIMSACLAQQEPLKIGFLGPEGTHSQQAVYKHFGHSIHGLPLASIEEVFQEVEAGSADFGVVPVENSTQGTIQSTLDMFLTSKLKISGEVELRVHQHLLSRSGRIEDIERVYSHPQSFAQCKAWLRQYLPKAEKIAVSSNAEAARRARNADDAAAIAGASAGNVYGLRNVAGPIEDRPDNTTRFLVIGRELFTPSGNDRTSLLIFIKDEPGALYNVLSPFAKRGLSMNRIESRPGHTGRWQYAFFVDIGGHVQEPAMREALEELEELAHEVKVLGSYPVAIA
ncbi:MULTISPECIES: prephenate dehydratase [unclassified Lysobacter]|uniref:prephenate dehydratase n=1 Tax=unclassified Lysobacter TaxID=2635362 RepID=UPI001BEAA152|nr:MULTISPECIES: prephenate dehydratase [unclassified Lysobacter]MBT2746865.1 prephenate dehydratase [Lysobacter sp. ISL-42]MBT2750650.1 prephenate dehydratase [Lysobacter sp. ISL-50]MBT2779479.1 prephenate dehydratase [Lysobacter sp. ISL-54]MBT2784686.1 prephenate dehydratase [Lysobacter sp. ISL-52]